MVYRIVFCLTLAFSLHPLHSWVEIWYNWRLEEIQESSELPAAFYEKSCVSENARVSKFLQVNLPSNIYLFKDNNTNTKKVKYVQS